MKYGPVILLLLLTLTIYGQENRGMIEIYINDELTILYEESHALVVGISEYEYWPDLPGVKKDVSAVSNALEEHGFHVEMGLNYTKQQMEDAISMFIAKYGQKQNNRLLFYFAGHGHTINSSYGDKQGYIALADSPLPRGNEAIFPSKATDMHQFDMYARRINSKHAFFVFDACFSGSLFSLSRAIPEIISYKTREPVRQFLTSGSEDEMVPDESIFRQQFVEALSTDYSDANKDGYITGSELGEYLTTTVVNYTSNSQHPQYGKLRHPGLDKGDFVFVVNNKKKMEITSQKDSEETSEMRLVPLKLEGSIQIESEIAGKLFVDGKYLDNIQAYIPCEIKPVSAGLHHMEIKGRESWKGDVIVKSDTPVVLKIRKDIKVNEFEIANRGRITDTRDGNKYSWIKIGDQIWMAENMKYYTAEGSWCYDHKESSCFDYGRLYNFEVAQDVCPEGWHLPSDYEWNQLLNYLAGMNKDGGALKSTDTEFWLEPNEGASNETGFNALPGGGRDATGTFLNQGLVVGMWSCSESDYNNAWIRALTNQKPDLIRNISLKESGFYVRCVKDQ